VGSFITGTELKVIHDEDWEEFETVTIREYSQAQKDVQDKELIEMAGQAGQLPRIVMQSALVPVLVAGIASWTLTMNGQKDGAVAPVTREWIGKLHPHYAGFIADEIRELNRGRTTAEEQDFLREARLGDTEQDEPAG